MSLRLIGYKGFLTRHILTYFSDVSLIDLSDEKFSDVQDIECNAAIFLTEKAKISILDKELFYRHALNQLKEAYTAFLKSETTNIFIYIGSISVLEEVSSSHPLLEDELYNGYSRYAKHNQEVEKWLCDQNLPIGKRLYILRKPLVYGNNCDGKIRILFNLIKLGIPYPLGNFDNKLSFISVKNLCFIISQLLDKHSVVASGIYNVADDDPVSMNHIVDMIYSVLNKRNLKFSLPQDLLSLITKLRITNSVKYKKLTSDFLISNAKIKDALKIDTLPYLSKNEIYNTIISLKNSGGKND
ncbi:epimerase [[Pasteurella] aerogenes]|nr:epimerase [[Pasteurella] aerogenes]